MQAFTKSRHAYKLAYACLVVFVGFFLFGLSLPLFQEDEPWDSGTLVIMGLSCLVFGFWIVGTLRAIRSLPYVDIALDDEGIWYQHRGRDDGLVPWSDIAAIRARPIWQTIRLYNRAGQRLLSISPNVQGLPELRRTLIERADLGQHDRAGRLSFPRRKGTWVGWLLGMVFLLALGALSFQKGQVLAGSFFVAVACVAGVGALMSGALRVEIADDCLVIIYPHKRLTIPFNEINKIHFREHMDQGWRFTYVRIYYGEDDAWVEIGGRSPDNTAFYASLCQRLGSEVVASSEAAAHST